MGNFDIREALKQAYPKSRKWARKIDRMSDPQVVAIYMRFQLQPKPKGVTNEPRIDQERHHESGGPAATEVA